jgi:hypothetical protein
VDTRLLTVFQRDFFVTMLLAIEIISRRAHLSRALNEQLAVDQWRQPWFNHPVTTAG